MKSGTSRGAYWECGLIPTDKRKVKPEQDSFMLAVMFFKNLSQAPVKMVKFTRKVDGEKQWDPEAKTKEIIMPDNKKEIM